MCSGDDLRPPARGTVRLAGQHPRPLDTDQVRVTTYAAGNNGITGLVNRVFTIWLLN